MKRNLLDRAGRIVSAASHFLISSLEDQMPMAILEESLRDLYEIDSEIALEIGQLEAYNALDLEQARNLNADHITITQNLTITSDINLQRAGIKRQVSIEKAQTEIDTTITTRRVEITTLTNKRAEVEATGKQIQKKIEDLIALESVEAKVENGHASSSGGVLTRAGAIISDAEYTSQRLVSTSNVNLDEDSEDLDRLMNLTTDREVEARLALLRGEGAENADSEPEEDGVITDESQMGAGA